MNSLDISQIQHLNIISSLQDNVLVDGDENICLTDFGLSVFQQEANETYGSTRAGNVRWLAPELIDPDRFQGEYARGRPTCASDIYSFACVCVEVRIVSLSQWHIIDRANSFTPVKPPSQISSLMDNFISEFLLELGLTDQGSLEERIWMTLYGRS